MKLEVPYGFCHCGCGERTKIAPRSTSCKGIVKGEPFRYIPGHQTRKFPYSHVEKDYGYETPCWVPIHPYEEGEYVRFELDGKRAMAHRIYYERYVGPVPDGLLLHHKCNNPPCRNPDHLEPVTNAVNTQLGRIAKVTPEVVREIRQAGSLVRARVFAEKFGISETTVERIRRRDTWKEVY